MRIEQLKIEDYKQVIQNAITNREECLLYAMLPKNIVYKGKGEIDEEYCQEHDFDVYNSIDFGGGIVGFEGDLIFVVLKQGGWGIGEQLGLLVKDYLTNCGLNASIANNDILIDDAYKVASYSSANTGDGFIYTAIQITFNADNEIIRHICKKDSVKIPRGLTYYNIDKDDLLYNILNYIERTRNE